MRRDFVLATIWISMTAGCAEDAAPSAPRAPSDDPSRDASVVGVDGVDDVDGVGGRSLDAGKSPTTDAGRPASSARGVPDAGAGCRALVSDALIEHACFHARGGPYRDVPETSESVDVSRPHTAFRLTLSPRGAVHAGTLTYRARATGAYALFASPGARLALVSGGASFAAHPTELCPELPEVAAHMLTEGLHEIRVESDRPDAMVVVESLDEGSFEDAYRVVCDAPVPLDAGLRAEVDAGVMRTATPRAAATSPEPGDVVAVASPIVPTPAAPSVEAAPPAPPVAVPEAPACRVDPVLEHACLHVRHGPFAEVDATRAEPPAVSTPHTVFALRLGDDGGRVAYRAALPGQYVFYLDADRALAVHAPEGALSPSHVEAVAGCEGLARAHVFTLAAGTRYEAHLAPGAANARLLVENVDSLTFDGWDARFEPCD